jgi:hypothetical protein
MRIHVGAHEEEFLGGDEVGAAEPLVVGPGVGLAEGVGEGTKRRSAGESAGGDMGGFNTDGGDGAQDEEEAEV